MGDLVSTKENNRLDAVVILLTGLVMFFSGVLIWIAVYLKSDGQTFQIIASLVTGFSGALLMRIKPRGSKDGDDIVLPGPPSRLTVNENKQTIAETTEQKPGES